MGGEVPGAGARDQSGREERREGSSEEERGEDVERQASHLSSCSPGPVAEEPEGKEGPPDVDEEAMRAEFAFGFLERTT